MPIRCWATASSATTETSCKAKKEDAAVRNFIACLLLLGLLAGLSACGADDSYLSVRTHVEPSLSLIHI